MLGPRWTTEELSRFYDVYRKYSKDWKKVSPEPYKPIDDEPFA